MTSPNGRHEHERGMDALQKWTIASLVALALGVVLLRLAVERVVE